MTKTINEDKDMFLEALSSKSAENSSINNRSTHNIAPHLTITTPASLALNWSAVKDYNLRTGIPNLEQLLSGKGRPPLDSHNFSVYVSKENPVGSLLLEFHSRICRFENQCTQHEIRYPLPPPTDDFETGQSILPAVGSGRTLIVSSTMSSEEALDVELLAAEAKEIINVFLDPRSPQFIGCPNEFLWRARAGLVSPGQSWPILFSAPKQHAFSALNNHFYQDFIDYSFHCNLSPISGQLCLISGSIFFVSGLTIALSLIFHAVPTVSLRITILPLIFLGLIFLLAAYTQFLPFFGLMSSRETGFRKHEPLIDPLVYKSHRRRALIHLGIGFGISVIVTVIFCLIPGYYLMHSV